MTPGDRFERRKGPAPESEDIESSFHGWLLDRSKTDLPDYGPREKMTWLAELWSWIGPSLAVGALVCGVLAIGAGALLEGDGGPTTTRSLVLMLIGVGGVVVGFGAILTQWLIFRWSAQKARG